ncbi:trace amine-associated receptor 13c-like [Polypterus senegalus]|uniref:trace amine-associated receptor 13c-like n=1 Tax=Polypterus senegalus TaxID=55291 RepID=UPI00196624EC|nr:trace amine-associated receptor 13c-like [Polypterus senegalus]
MELPVKDNQSVQYCFHSGNISCLKEIRTKYSSVILYIFGTAAVVLTFCGNLVVIISISHFKQLHTPTNILVLSLAVADFLVGVIIMPFMLIQSVETCWYFGETVCYIYTCFLTTLTTVSVFNLVLIAIDRYFAVCDPLLYSTRITVRITCIAVLIIWLLTFSYACAEVFSGGSIEGNLELDPCPGDCLLLLNSTWSIVDPIFGFIFPVYIMAILYTKIFIVAKRHAKAISIQQNSQNNKYKSNKSKKSERKAAKTLGIVMAVFLFCLSPIYIFTVINFFTNVTLPSAVSCTLIWLIYLNSSMNPIMYALFYPWFQKSFKLIVTLQICRNGSSLIKLIPEY